MKSFATIFVCSAIRERISSQLGNEMDFHVIHLLLNLHSFEKMKSIVRMIERVSILLLVRSNHQVCRKFVQRDLDAKSGMR